MDRDPYIRPYKGTRHVRRVPLPSWPNPTAYFADEESIKQWRDNAEHTLARNGGRAKWYQHIAVHVAKVERAYRWDREEPSGA